MNQNIFLLLSTPGLCAHSGASSLFMHLAFSSYWFWIHLPEELLLSFFASFSDKHRNHEANWHTFWWFSLTGVHKYSNCRDACDVMRAESPDLSLPRTSGSRVGARKGKNDNMHISLIQIEIFCFPQEFSSFPQRGRNVSLLRNIPCSDYTKISFLAAASTH